MVLFYHVSSPAAALSAPMMRRKDPTLIGVETEVPILEYLESHTGRPYTPGAFTSYFIFYIDK
jgi:hypothetical protein